MPFLDLDGPWAGWRLRGRDLVSPDGDRISVRQLRGLLYLEHLRTWVKRHQGTADAANSEKRSP